MGYLRDYQNSLALTDVINRIVEENGFKVLLMVGKSIDFIGATLILGNPKNSHSFYLSEFPGNCGILILHNIQTYYQANLLDEVKMIVKVCIAISKYLRYGILMITTTDLCFCNWLIEEFNFNISENNIFINLHSGRTNRIMIKTF